MKNRTPQEIDWHVLNPLCLECTESCRQCAAVSVVGCKYFKRVKVNTGAKGLDRGAQLWLDPDDDRKPY